MSCKLLGLLFLLLIVCLGANGQGPCETREKKYAKKCLNKCQEDEQELIDLGCQLPCDRSSDTEERQCVDAADECVAVDGLCPDSQKCCPVAEACDETQPGVTCEGASTCPDNPAGGQTQNANKTCPGGDVCCVRTCLEIPILINCENMGECLPTGRLIKSGFACPDPNQVCCERIGPGR